MDALQPLQLTKGCEMKIKELKMLIDDGDVEECIACGGYSAYSWDNVSDDLSDESDIYSRPTAKQHHLSISSPYD